MTLTQAKRLQRFDKFRRESRNSHDNGFRVYTVTLAYPEGFTAVDQHGYHMRCHWNDSSVKPFLKGCEKIVDNAVDVSIDGVGFFRSLGTRSKAKSGLWASCRGPKMAPLSPMTKT